MINRESKTALTLLERMYRPTAGCIVVIRVEEKGHDILTERSAQWERTINSRNSMSMNVRAWGQLVARVPRVY